MKDLHNKHDPLIAILPPQLHVEFPTWTEAAFVTRFSERVAKGDPKNVFLLNQEGRFKETSI